MFKIGLMNAFVLLFLFLFVVCFILLLLLLFFFFGGGFIIVKLSSSTDVLFVCFFVALQVLVLNYSSFLIVLDY